MAELLSLFAKIILVVLAKVDKAKHQALIDNFYDRVHADPCGVLVEQLGGKASDTTSATVDKRKSGDC